MRFTEAWAETYAQNVTLKVATVSLALVSVALSITVARLSKRAPLLIERGCLTRAITLSASDATLHSTQEIEAFVREAIPQRFNSDATPQPEYLSAEEEVARTREQKELGARSMNQFVFIRSVKTAGSNAVVEADRLISVGPIRSAFPFALTLTLSTVARTDRNPYGLQLAKVEQPKTEVK